MEFVDMKDFIFLVGTIATVVTAWSVVKFQGINNSKTVNELKSQVIDDRKIVFKRIDELRDKNSDYETRLRLSLDMDTAEKKFVSKELFELKMKQFDLDLKENKHINQATLDAVHMLTTTINSMRKQLMDN